MTETLDCLSKSLLAELFPVITLYTGRSMRSQNDGTRSTLRDNAGEPAPLLTPGAQIPPGRIDQGRSVSLSVPAIPKSLDPSIRQGPSFYGSVREGIVSCERRQGKGKGRRRTFAVELESFRARQRIRFDDCPATFETESHLSENGSLSVILVIIFDRLHLEIDASLIIFCSGRYYNPDPDPDSDSDPDPDPRAVKANLKFRNRIRDQDLLPRGQL